MRQQTAYFASSVTCQPIGNENDGIDQTENGIIDEFTNGIDDNGIGVDDLTEVEGPTPYPVPLKGIQIKIRIFDPDSREIREVTVTSDFTSAG